VIKSMAFLEVITLCCDPSGGLHGTQDRVNQHLRRKFILTCPASNSDIPRNVHVLINPPLAERCLHLPLYPLSIANLRPFPSPCFGVGSVLFSVSGDFRKSSRRNQTRSLEEGENRRTPQEVHLQLSPQEPPEQHLQSPHGPIFRILGVEWDLGFGLVAWGLCSSVR
jgi:hypothetical protein